MILAFSKEFPKTYFKQKKTYFQEKILASIFDSCKDIPKEYLENETLEVDLIDYIHPKLHTMRKTIGKRKLGTKFSPSINVRTKKQRKFAPDVECKQYQEVDIKVIKGANTALTFSVDIDGKHFGEVRFLGGSLVSPNANIRRLALNDGFDGVKDFVQYFIDGGKYYLFGWTDLKYGED